MKKSSVTEVLIIVESGFLADISLKQSSHSRYLYEQASQRSITIAIPEYAFAEADGSLHRRFAMRHQKLQEMANFANELARSRDIESHVQQLKTSITTLRNLMEESLNLAKADLADLRQGCLTIPPTIDILHRGMLRSLSSAPPPDKVDCLILESVLNFLSEHQQEYVHSVFLCHDRQHFDHPEIHQEIANLGAQMVFSSSECIGNIRDVFA